MDTVQEIKALVDAKKGEFLDAADKVWSYAELGFKEFQSAKALTDVLKTEGFVVEEGVAGIPTAFIGSWGEGKPIIGLLGEYDALPALAHKAGDANENDEIVTASGHGCGHNLLGAGSLGAAIAVKDYMQKHGLKGTIRYYGCPERRPVPERCSWPEQGSLTTWTLPSPGTAAPRTPSLSPIRWPMSAPTSSSKDAPAMPQGPPISAAARWTPAS